LLILTKFTAGQFTAKIYYGCQSIAEDFHCIKLAAMGQFNAPLPLNLKLELKLKKS
jgi:hypothetical protein